MDVTIIVVRRPQETTGLIGAAPSYACKLIQIGPSNACAA